MDTAKIWHDAFSTAFIPFSDMEGMLSFYLLHLFHALFYHTPLTICIHRHVTVAMSNELQAKFCLCAG